MSVFCSLSRYAWGEGALARVTLVTLFSVLRQDMVTKVTDARWLLTLSRIGVRSTSAPFTLVTLFSVPRRDMVTKVTNARWLLTLTRVG